MVNLNTSEYVYHSMICFNFLNLGSNTNEKIKTMPDARNFAYGFAQHD